MAALGIETEAQWDFLAQAGCAKGQGFLFVAVAQLPAVIEAAARFVREPAPAAPDIPRQPRPDPLRNGFPARSRAMGLGPLETAM